MKEEYENLTVTTLIYTNGARIRITVAAGTKFHLSNITCTSVLCQIYLVHGTLAMLQTLGGLERACNLVLCLANVPSLDPLFLLYQHYHILGGFGGVLGFGTA